MMSAHDQYALGRSPKEYARLARQAEIMKPMTLRLFSEAGIRPGMNVLDLGSGAGDVAMLLAEMVGPSGSVIGLDLDHDATLHARERTIAAQFHNITFVHIPTSRSTAPMRRWMRSLDVWCSCTKRTQQRHWHHSSNILNIPSLTNPDYRSMLHIIPLWSPLRLITFPRPLRKEQGLLVFTTR
jgi:SAM-dependent methyltransferase